MVATILSWVLTYALHSTVLILSIWLICRYVPRLSLATQELLWKLALGGAIVSTTVQLGAGVTPPWGHVEMPQALSVESTEVSSTAPTTTPPSQVHHRAGELKIVATRTAAPSTAVAAMPTEREGGGALPWVVLSLVLAGSIIGLVRVGLGARTLRRQLAGRRDVIEDPLLEGWLSLCSKANLTKRVRLTASPTIPSPIALVGREVCVPERAIDGLTPAQQQSMLAHELAHVLRRDPAWFIASAIVEAVFFFQPLHYLVRRKLEEVSEFQCDDWAAQQGGTGVHLAKCLAEVAAWVDRQPSSPMVATMAGARSPIIRRITRLLDDARTRTSELPRPWRFGGALALLGGVAWLAPAVSARAQTVATPSPAAKLPQIVVEDVGGRDGHDRARVRIVGEDASIDLDVAAPRALPPPPAPVPPPAPPAPPHSSEMRIIIQGGWAIDGWMFGPGSGYLGIEIEGFDPFGGPDLFDGDGFDFGDVAPWEDAAEALEEAAEARAEALEEAAEAREEAAEAAAEAWEEAIEARAEALEAAAEAFADGAVFDVRAQRAEAEARAAADAARAMAASPAPRGTAPAGLIAL